MWTPFNKNKILHGPKLIILDLQIKKMKRRNLKNIYKFILDSRKQIRAYPEKLFEGVDNEKKPGSKNPISLNKERIFTNDCRLIFEENIVIPIKNYIEDSLSKCENVNGCITNSNLDVHRYG